MTATSSPRVLASERGAHALGELVEGQAPLDHVLAQQGHGAVAIRVCHALCQAASGGGRAGHLGNRTFRHRRQSAPSDRARSDPTSVWSVLGHPLGSSVVRGIISAAGYVPYRRLARGDISAFMGSGGGKGTRAVASHDEDTTTLGFEAARLALRGAPGCTPDSLWFATAQPAYLDKTNATAVAAALRLPGDVAAFDFGGALRSGMGALVAALGGGGTTLVGVVRYRDGLPTSGDEAAGGDAGAAVVVGEGPGVIAEFVAAASATDEFTDRWRAPGDRTSKLWEERFGENRYIALGQEALGRAMKAAGVESGGIGRLAITGMHGRAVSGLAKKLALGDGVVVDDLGSSVGQSGTAHPLLVLASTLESLAAEGAPAGTVVVLVHLADGADAIVLRTTEALGSWRAARALAGQVAAGAPITYAQILVVAGAAAA